ncbi:hypothetical protein CAPTEDRAFT_199060 [Capitella teleta]|uniref:Sushi domain-containing protein n=1 Tax=Capitella teleta TaxID=283909 RepID=R7UMR9_CAPTE|nr:hypothetical protein CAPTEDRAFT_199060 [Capitella teleta]|eukprot:ELU07393.1 hypothetical protein CAPTEDRAFT_199060 [Capitella teleta]
MGGNCVGALLALLVMLIAHSGGDCPPPEEIEHGHIITSLVSYPSGTSVEYGCASGYTASNETLLLTCEDSDAWDQGWPTCQRVSCGMPTPIPFAEVNTTGIRFEDNATYACLSGFEADSSKGGLTRVCQEDGLWSGADPECIAIECDAVPTVLHANYTPFKSTYHYPELVSFICDDGYQLDLNTEGVSKVRCEADGTWNLDALECTRVNCPQGDSPENMDADESFYFYGDVREYRCKDGYYIASGDSSRSCQADAVSCMSPRNTDTVEVITKQDKFLYTDQVEFACISGYEHESGDLKRTCQADKRWSGDSPQCKGIVCGEPPTGSGVVRLDNDFRYPKQVTFTCGVGYRKVSGSTFRVSQANGTWSGDPLICTRILCSEPAKVMYAVMNTTSSEFNFGDVIQYECIEGFVWDEQSGDLTRTCETDRQFSGSPPKCTKIECGDPGTYPGTYKLGNSFKYGDRVNYTCANGYQQASSVKWSIVQCGADGNWNGTLPDCTRISCVDPGEVENAYKNGSDHLFEDRVQYVCFEGYYIETGLDTITCTSIGQWNFPRPICQEVPEAPPLADLGPPDPPTESAGSEIVGVMGLGIVIVTASCVVLLDLATIKQQVQYLVRNIKDGRTNCIVYSFKEFLDERKKHTVPNTPLIGDSNASVD